jgi:hypothetical protein
MNHPLVRAAVVFVPRRLSAANLAARLRASEDLGNERFELTAETVEFLGDGYHVKITIQTHLRDVMARASAIGQRLDETRRCSTALLVEFRLDQGFRGTRYSVASVAGAPLGAWAPTSAGLSSHESPIIPWQVLSATESLASLDGALAYDDLLRAFYPS